MTLQSWKIHIHDTGGPTVTVTLTYSFKEPFRPERGRVVRRKNVFRYDLQDVADEYLELAVGATLDGHQQAPTINK